MQLFRTYLIACLLMLWAASFATAQQIDLTVDQRTRIEIGQTADLWDIEFRPHLPSDCYELVGTCIYVATDVPAGTYQLDVVGTRILWDERRTEQFRGAVEFVIGSSPEPDPDPDPEPDPTPDPEPSPSDAPFPSDGLAVMIIREAGDVGNLPEAQKAIFTSAELMKYLTGHCVDDEYGIPMCRIWDDDYADTDLTNVSATLRRAYHIVVEDAGSDLPWIGISNGESGVSQPLPATVEETLELIEQFED